MATEPNILVVILNFNGWQETLICVDSVLKQSHKNSHIYLIDNGSEDDSLEKLTLFENHSKITYLKNPVNAGFAGGVNIGIRHAIENDYEYVALLNNDAVIEKDWLKKLHKSLTKNDASVVTGLLLDGSGKKIESTGDSYSAWGLPFPRQRDEKVSDVLDSGFVFGGTAGASLYKTELFKDIGLFDETFFAYFEDTDISFRAQLTGHKAYYERTAIAYHDHGTTSNKIPGFTVQQTFKNLPIFFWKNIPFKLLLPIGLRFYMLFSMLYIRAVVRGQFKAATLGLLKGIALYPHAFRERWFIQKNKRVSTEYLRSIIYPGLPPNNKQTARRIFHR